MSSPNKHTRRSVLGGLGIALASNHLYRVSSLTTRDQQNRAQTQRQRLDTIFNELHWLKAEFPSIKSEYNKQVSVAKQTLKDIDQKLEENFDSVGATDIQKLKSIQSPFDGLSQQLGGHYMPGGFQLPSVSKDLDKLQRYSELGDKPRFKTVYQSYKKKVKENYFTTLKRGGGVDLFGDRRYAKLRTLVIPRPNADGGGPVGEQGVALRSAMYWPVDAAGSDNILIKFKSGPLNYDLNNTSYSVTTGKGSKRGQLPLADSQPGAVALPMVSWKKTGCNVGPCEWESNPVGGHYIYKYHNPSEAQTAYEKLRSEFADVDEGTMTIPSIGSVHKLAYEAQNKEDTPLYSFSKRLGPYVVEFGFRRALWGDQSFANTWLTVK